MTPRIRRLLDRALDHDIIPVPVRVGFDPADLALPEPVRIGKRLSESIAAQPVAVREDEELVGWLPFDGTVEADLYRRTGHRAFAAVFREWYRKPKENLAIFEWQHACADFPALVSEGLEGVRRRIEASRAAHAGDRARLDYLDGLSLALNALVARQRKSAAECRRLAGVGSIGFRPTFPGARPDRPVLEVHLLDFRGDLYGRALDIAFLARLRDERAFPNADELFAQIARDADAAKSVFERRPRDGR